MANDSQLCEATGTNRQTMGNWRSRNSVPYTLCVSVAEERGVSLDWLLTGEGAMLRGEADPVPKASVSNPQEEAILALFRSLEEADKREIQRAAEEKKRLSSLEQRVSELEAVVADGKRLA